MRDDLHRSVPPRTHWARVLRLACRRATEEELRLATTQAVRHDTEWLGTSWGEKFEAALERSSNDLFPQEQLRAELNRLMHESPNQHARTSCEIALGLLARDEQTGPGFKTKVMDAAMRVQAADCVEHVASLVANKFDSTQARLVRRRLAEILSGCDLTQAPPKPTKATKASIEADLDSVLEMATS